MSTLEKLTAALDELEEWILGNRSNWNNFHGTVTGDYEGQFVNTANADNADKIALAARVTGLAAILSAESGVLA